jgi:hypothetical protein
MIFLNNILMGLIRAYERIAQKDHWCDNCCNYIHSGEVYRAEVFINTKRKKNRLVVFKYHINPRCEPPEDPEEEMRMKSRKTLEKRLRAA